MSDIYQKGCLIICETRWWGATRKLDPEQLGDLPKEIVHATRDLLVDNNKLGAVRGIIGEAKRFIKANTIDFPIPGFDFINKNRISYVDNALKGKKEYALEAVDDFLVVLNQAKRVYRERFPGLYSEANYPTKAQLLDNFKFVWKFVMLNPPGKDSEVLSPEVYERAVTDFKQDMKTFEDNLISTVAKEFYDRIDKLRIQCMGADISAATVKSIHTVLEKFDNIYDGCLSHDGLKGMIKDIKDYMKGTDAGMLKASDNLREMVGDKMKSVTELLVNSPDERLTRKLDG